MIKFFRNIRRNLLNEGHMGKYLKYAIGEIVLVVIGILIALSINNWNQANKNRVKENAYLKKLVSNLEDDIELYEEYMAIDSSMLDRLNDLLRALTRPDETEIYKIRTNIPYLMTHQRFTPNKTTFDNLISSGQMEIIRNDSLVERLFLYYREVDIIKTGIDNAISDYSRNTFGPFVLEYGNTKHKDEDMPYYKNHPFLVNSTIFKLNLVNGQINKYREQIVRASDLIEIIHSDSEND